MSKQRPTIGTDGLPLPILPPERDGRVWAKMVRVAVYTPGFLALLLIKTGEPAGFGITVELLMLATATAIVAGLYLGAQSSDAGDDHAPKVGNWCGALLLELLAVVPILCAVPSLFHELAHSTLDRPLASRTSLRYPSMLSEWPHLSSLRCCSVMLCGFPTMRAWQRSP